MKADNSDLANVALEDIEVDQTDIDNAEFTIEELEDVDMDAVLREELENLSQDSKNTIEVIDETPCYFQLMNTQTQTSNQPYKWDKMRSHQLHVRVN